MQCQAVAPAMQTHQETSLVLSVQVGTGRFISANDSTLILPSQVFKQVISNHIASYPFLSANKFLQVISFQFESANGSVQVRLHRFSKHFPSIHVLSDQLDKRIISFHISSTRQTHQVHSYSVVSSQQTNQVKSFRIHSANWSYPVLSDLLISNQSFPCRIQSNQPFPNLFDPYCINKMKGGETDVCSV